MYHLNDKEATLGLLHNQHLAVESHDLFKLLCITINFSEILKVK